MVLIACRIRFAIPKGSLEKAVNDFLDRAGYRLAGRERSYRPRINDPEICVKILRPQEIPVYVAEGLYDVAITGMDWVIENKLRDKIAKLLDLEFGRVKLVVAVPRDLPYSSTDSLIDGYFRENRTLRIATEYLNISREFIMERESYRKIYGDRKPVIISPWFREGDNDMIQIILSFGATEAKPPEEVDAIIDITETGITLENNNLRAIDIILESQAILISNPSSLRDPNKREKIMDMVALFRGVVDGRKKYHIFLNVRKDNLEKLLDILPALKKPTVSQLSDPEWYAINTVIDKDELLKILPTIRKLAQGLVVYEPKLVIPLEKI